MNVKPLVCDTGARSWIRVSARVTGDAGRVPASAAAAGAGAGPVGRGQPAAREGDGPGDRLSVELASLAMLVEGSSSSVVRMGEADTVHRRMLDAKLLSSASAPVVTR